MTAAAHIIDIGTVDTIYLHPGQMCFCDRPTRVETVLGSCVAVTMWDARLSFGCICHAVLPSSGGMLNQQLKYVDSSVQAMLSVLEQHSSRRQDLEVKLFGGASIGRTTPGRWSVGRQNVDSAMALLQHEGFTLRTSDTGGSAGRKLLFYTATGEVFVKRISMEARR